MNQLRIRDVMTRDVRSVRRTTPIKQVAAILAGQRISAVPVVDDEQAVVGVVSEADLLPKEVPPGRWASRGRKARYAARTAEQVMTTPALTVEADGSIVDAARRMTHERVKRLPVVDRDGKLVGIVSRVDLIALYARGDEALRAEIVVEVFEEILSIPAKQAEAAVSVEDGVVTLTGELDRKSSVPIAVSLTRRVPGVVDVVDQFDLRVRRHAPQVRAGEPRRAGLVTTV